ncbi:MAG: 1-aminocyclopropane-1-carboxylate deaminase/D-cysteine desulfhydrase, partial [Planctomycetota bacterium]
MFGTAPPRLALAHLPTPLQPLIRFSETLGIRLAVKRDDLTGAVETGNKIRKLEYLCADALERGCDTLITCGGVQSNHCRATAAVAARLGLKCVLVLRGEAPAAPNGNYFLDQVLGASVRFITVEQWAVREAIMGEEAAKVADAGGSAYVMPEGGSNAMGAWGYIRGFAELLDQACTDPFDGVDVIVHAAGSGGTTAGLAIGAAHAGWEGRLVAVPVCDDGPYFQAIVDRIAAEVGATTCAVEFPEQYKGEAYGVPYDAEMQWVNRLAREEGIICDPVYSGKA